MQEEHAFMAKYSISNIRDTPKNSNPHLYSDDMIYKRNGLGDPIKHTKKNDKIITDTFGKDSSYLPRPEGFYNSEAISNHFSTLFPDPEPIVLHDSKSDILGSMSNSLRIPSQADLQLNQNEAADNRKKLNETHFQIGNEKIGSFNSKNFPVLPETRFDLKKVQERPNIHHSYSDNECDYKIFDNHLSKRQYMNIYGTQIKFSNPYKVKGEEESLKNVKHSSKSPFKVVNTENFVPSLENKDEYTISIYNNLIIVSSDIDEESMILEGERFAKRPKLTKDSSKIMPYNEQKSKPKRNSSVEYFHEVKIEGVQQKRRNQIFIEDNSLEDKNIDDKKKLRDHLITKRSDSSIHDVKKLEDESEKRKLIKTNETKPVKPKEINKLKQQISDEEEEKNSDTEERYKALQQYVFSFY